MRCKRIDLYAARVLLCLIVLAVSQVRAYEPLFNGSDLQGWDVWLGAREVSTLPFKLWGEWQDVIGLNTPNTVFSVVEEEGEPAIRVSGQFWGALVSSQSYSNYHLRLQFKWGEARYAPRAEKPRNTGLLYHSVGEYGAFWSYWMRSAEFEIMQGSTGNLTSVDGVRGSLPLRWDFDLPVPWLRYDASGTQRQFGNSIFRAQAAVDAEKPAGQWNDLEVVVAGDSARHIVNGQEVLVVTELRTPDGQPLTAGRIQLQSEGAEVYFRRIELQVIAAP